MAGDRSGRLLALKHALAACALLAGAWSAHAQDAAPPHHDAHGFFNPTGAAAAKPLSDFIRWKIDAWREGLPPPPQAPTPVVAPAIALLRANTAPIHTAGSQAAHVPVPSATGSATQRFSCSAAD